MRTERLEIAGLTELTDKELTATNGGTYFWPTSLGGFLRLAGLATGNPLVYVVGELTASDDDNPSN
jgi:hypothetical protein